MHILIFILFLKKKKTRNIVGNSSLVQRPTEKPGAILTRVRVPGAAVDFSPTVNFQCRLPLGVRASSVCKSHAPAAAGTINIPSSDYHTVYLDTEKYCTYW